MTVRALAAVVVLAAGCFKMGIDQPGAQVAVSTLHARADDLPGYVAELVDKRKVAKAFYALEVHKLRGYAAPALAAHHPLRAGELVAGHRDLRPVFAAAFQAARPDGEVVASRGLTVVPEESPSTLSEFRAEGDSLFWSHLQVMEARFGTQLPYGMVVRGGFAPVTSIEAAQMFDRGEVYVSFLVHGDRVYAFVLRRGKLRVVPLPAPARDIRAAATAFVDMLRAPPADPADASWRAPAAALYDMIFRPLGPALSDPKLTAVYVSPDGFLSSLPLGLLVDGDRPLLARALVTYIPSASLYRRLLYRDILSAPPAFLAVGNPVYPEGVPPLPYAALEAETLATVFSRAALFSGGTATEAATVAAFADHNILHFATHGVLLGAAVPGGSSLMLAADADHDGFLSAVEIAGLDLSHVYLAVLSACETSVGSGRSAELGAITSAFLAAGAPSVVGTLWKVSDTSTTRLMIDFYRQFLYAGAALREAQLKLASRPEYAHPYYWAPFVLHGWAK